MKLFLFNLAALLALGTAVFAQSPDSTIHSYARFGTRQLYPPASLILAGLIANGHSQESIKNELVEERNEMIPHFKTPGRLPPIFTAGRCFWSGCFWY
jgi:hypothetical protein